MKMNFDIFNDDDKTLKTDKLSIKNNTILMKNDAIQIKNISMMSSSELVFRLKFSEILMMLVMILALFIDFIPKVIPLVILLFWGYSIYNKYQKHLSEKFYIEFNLGSSKNYYLFFKGKEFRNRVFDIIRQSFNDGFQVVNIDIKNQNINNGSGTQEINQKKVVNKTDVSGNDNVVGSHFGEGSTFSIKGDAINRSSIIENSVASDVSYKTEVQIPWEQVHQEITNIISTQIFSHQMNMVLEELQEASKNKNEEQFEKIVKNNERIFDLPFLKSAISATLANLISGILGY